MIEIACRGTALLWDIQMDAARNLLEAQARRAAAFGAPDYSGLFHVADERARRMFTAATEQMLDVARETQDTVSEMNNQFSRLVERQTVQMNDDIRSSIEDMGRRAREGMEQVRRAVHKEGEEMERAGWTSTIVQPSGETQTRSADPKRSGAGARTS